MTLVALPPIPTYSSMRRARFQAHRTFPIAAAVVAAAALVCPTSVDARVCSVLDEQPCVYHPFDQVCDAFGDRPCPPPELEYPWSEQLQLTIVSRDPETRDPDRSHRDTAETLGTIAAVFAALRSCWVPPDKEASRPGTQVAVRLSFKRDGDIFGRPRITYVTPGLPGAVRQAYWDAVEAAVERCTPLAFTQGLGGALAGRPFAIRFVDKRSAS